MAAFLFAQLEHAEKINAARSRLFEQYTQLLRPLEEKGAIRLPSAEPEKKGNGHIFHIIAGSLEERSRLIDFLQQNGILAVFHYVPLHSSPAGIKYGRTAGTMRVTDDLSERVLRLPIYYEMNKSELEWVVSNIMEFYGF